MILDPRNLPAWDLPPEPSSRTYVIASTPRTGSTLLCRALWATGCAGAPKEYLNPMQVRDWEVRLGARSSRLLHLPLRGPLLALAGRRSWSDARFAAHLARVRARRSGGGWFGLKLHRHHFEQWFVLPGRAPEAFLGPITWIRIVRADREAQAVSWARALQTGRWAAHERGWLPPVYSARRIAACLRRIARDEAAWDAWFAARDVRPQVVTYEALAADRRAAVRGVLAALGVAPPETLPEPDLARQSDAISAAWRARYRAEARPA